ncbi:MAG: GlpG protein, partial [Halioglobus sp.]
MSEFYPALSVSVEEDLLPLSALLQQKGVLHRIFEDSGQQVLEVVDENMAPQVQALYQAWRNNEVSIELSKRERPATQNGLAVQARQVPVTVGLIALSVCGFLFVFLGPLNFLISYLTFSPFELNNDQLVFSSMGGQYWRLVTPVFLHFGWMHIVFNSLWMWDLGEKVESVMGRFNM